MTKTRGGAAIYARISRDIAGTGYGVERQLDDCRALAERLGVKVIHEFTDNDTSAYSGRIRPGYRALMDAIERGEVGTVLCWHTDRLHRQTRELETYIATCDPRNVSTHSVTAGELDLSTPSGRATAKTRGAWAQYESEHKAERIRRQKLQAAQQGRFLGGRIPWGWRRTAEGFEVDPVAARFIADGTRHILSGLSLIEVTRRWADGGALSLSGTRMNTTQVRRILMRSRNAGILTFHGEPVGSDWPPIVTVEEFRQMAAILNDPTRPAQSESKYRYLMSGLARCWCGRAMVGFGAQATAEHPEYRRSYRCSVHSEGGRYVRGHANRGRPGFDEYVTEVVAALLEREDVRHGLLSYAVADGEAPTTAGDDSTALIARRESLARMFAAGQIEEAQLVEGTAQIRDALAELETNAAAHGRNRALVTAFTQDRPAEYFRAASLDARRAIIRALVTVDLLEGAPRGGVFSPAHVTIKPRLWDAK
ncbi:hypothetical protein B5P43_31780 [Bacillus sp. SRB_336]|nr:hypothetical protein B5P43_31780 [Bacillus sp. SRB_336]